MTTGSKTKPTSGAPTQFSQSEFEQVKDSSLSTTSAYNWDSSPAVNTASVGDPNADAFFNSLLEDDKKVNERFVYGRKLLTASVKAECNR